MRAPQLRLSLEHELIVDQFAGGGGASLGIEMALGRSPDIAINHDPEAVALHEANHPTTKHYCESVWDVDPLAVTGGRPVGLMWLSPDCKHFSKAKGGKPVEKKIRGLAWIAVKWAKLIKPRVIILENVEEFQDWGPLTPENKPCPERKGLTFHRWKKQLENAGYAVDWRELRACDYGAPTIRKRLFLVARRDGRPIVWPVATHGDPSKAGFKASGLKPWRTAAECIDWSIPCPSIFERTRPLADNTLNRIRAGIERYVIKAKKPFIVQYHSPKREGDHRNRPVDEPLNTQSTENRFGLVAASISRIGQTGGGMQAQSTEKPLSTVVSKQEHLLVASSLMTNTTGHSGASADSPVPTLTTGPQQYLVGASLVGVGGRAGQSRPRDVDEPTATATSKYDTAMVAPFITKFREGSIGSALDAPLHTITAGGEQARPGTGNAMGIVAPIIVSPAHSTTTGRGPNTWPVDSPLRTTSSVNDKMLIGPILVQTGYGEREGQAPRALDIEKPIGTLVGTQKHGLVAAFLNKHNAGHGAIGQPATDPVHTITARDTKALTTVELRGEDGLREAFRQINSEIEASNLIKLKGTAKEGQATDTPLHTVQAGGQHYAEVRAFLSAYYGTEQDTPLTDPMHTIPTRDRYALVMVNGEPYYISDIGMRMLNPPELFAAQSFPPSYTINILYKGKPLPKSSQVRMCGNSVCPVLAEAMVAANYKIVELEAVA